MNLLLLGHGKTGSLVAEVARERGHSVRIVRSVDNVNCAALAAENLGNVEVLIDFTTPHAVVANLTACTRAGKSMVVGTTGWYDHLPQVRQAVEKNGTGLVYAANFSLGVNLFFAIARTAAEALRHGYHGQIFERHHIHKKDAPSGTAQALQKVVQDASQHELEITSFREGDVVGMHEVTLDSANDTLYVCHDAKSRRGFAEGAVRAAEWVRDKKGCFDFRDIWQQV
jgi:4-hydroxy-tetrahydrodipicolinate reductase